LGTRNRTRLFSRMRFAFQDQPLLARFTLAILSKPTSNRRGLWGFRPSGWHLMGSGRPRRMLAPESTNCLKSRFLFGGRPFLGVDPARHQGEHFPKMKAAANSSGEKESGPAKVVWVERVGLELGEIKPARGCDHVPGPLPSQQNSEKNSLFLNSRSEIEFQIS
jgi:hypothetical protein